MDVSNRSDNRVENLEEPGGQKLIETVVNLTELPEPLVPLVYNEVDQILKMSGHDSGELTLENLRTAMLAYLEATHAEVSAAEPAAALDADANQQP